MTDIIQDAKKLLEGATPGPWKFEERTGYEYPAGPEWGPMMTELEHSVQDKDGYHLFGAYNDYRMTEAPGNLPLAAAAPELAQALAEETWEYTQEIYFNGKWQPIYEDLWYENPEECESLFLDIEPWKYHDEPLRIVRRRVSEPEVINE